MCVTLRRAVKQLDGRSVEALRVGIFRRADGAGTVLPPAFDGGQRCATHTTTRSTYARARGHEHVDTVFFIPRARERGRTLERMPRVHRCTVSWPHTSVSQTCLSQLELLLKCGSPVERARAEVCPLLPALRVLWASKACGVARDVLEDGIVWRFVSGRGLALFAQRDFRSGETVVEDVPFFTRPSPEAVRNHKGFTAAWVAEFQSIWEPLSSHEEGKVFASAAMVRNAIGFATADVGWDV